MKTWFPLDFMILFPAWLLSSRSVSIDGAAEDNSQGAISLLRVFRLSKAMQLLRVARLRRAMRQLTYCIHSESVRIGFFHLQDVLLLLSAIHIFQKRVIRDWFKVKQNRGWRL